METIATVDDTSFEREVLAAEGPVLVEVSTAWCGPCKALAPIVEQLAGEYRGQVKVVMLDGDEAPRTTAALSVRGFPTLVVMRGGKEVARQLGLVPRAKVAALMERGISASAPGAAGDDARSGLCRR
jgi:thioredoxin 1